MLPNIVRLFACGPQNLNPAASTRCLYLFAVALFCTAARASDLPVIAVRYNPSPAISLDGKLDESAWRDAPVLRLIQQSPKPGVSSEFKTEARIVVTNDKVYFAFN